MVARLRARYLFLLGKLMTNQIANKTAGGSLKIGILISGSGTNLQAIIDAAASGSLDVEIVKVISSRPDAYGLTRAQEAGIPAVALNREIYADKEAADQRIVDELKEAGVMFG